MTKEQVLSICSDLNNVFPGEFPASESNSDTYYGLDHLSYIFTDSDEVFYIDPEKTRFKFDFQNELLYIYDAKYFEENGEKILKIKNHPSSVVDFELIIGFVSANNWRMRNSYVYGMR